MEEGEEEMEEDDSEIEESKATAMKKQPKQKTAKEIHAEMIKNKLKQTSKY